MNRAHAFKQLVLARMREFFREPIAIFWVYGFPLLLACALGAAFSKSKVDPPTVDVVQSAREKPFKDIVTPLKAKEVDVQVNDHASAIERLRNGKTALIINLNADSFGYEYDPTRPENVHAKHHVDSILARSQCSGLAPPEEILVKTPGSRYIDFLLPGLVGINIMGGGLFGVGFVLVEMRVRKLFKRLMATPMHRGDFLLAMLSSRLLFLIPEMASLLVLARWMFGVPNYGSWGTLTLVVFTGAMAFAGIGLLLGCRAEKTETISGLLNFVMVPSYTLSGVFFSAKNFPEVVQPLIQALPLTQLNNALREVMLEGASLANVSGRLLVLAAWGVVTFALALRWFKWM